MSSKLLNDVREAFSQSADDKRAAGRLSDLLKEAPVEEPVYKAYQGMAVAMSARKYFNPVKKLATFQKGTGLINEAVAAEPELAEVRFVRFMLQKNAPAALGYNRNQQEDYEVMLTALDDEVQLKQLGDWVPRVARVLHESEFCKAADVERLLKYLR